MSEHPYSGTISTVTKDNLLIYALRIRPRMNARERWLQNEKDMAEYRSKTRAKANEVGLSVEQMIYLALYHLQIDKEDAWDFATQGKDINVAKKYRKEQMAEAESKGKAFLNMLDDRDNSDFDPNDKQSIIRRLQAEINSPEPNNAVIQGLTKMADLQNMKKEENAKDDTTIHYYLPITCQMCELMEKAKRE